VGKVIRIDRFRRRREVKAEEDGTFTGLAAVFGNRDGQGDIIEPGAFDRTVRERPEVPILANHDITQVIGLGRLSVTSRGLRVVGRLNTEVQAARETLSNIRFGAVSGLSIGYNKRDFKRDRNGRRLLDLDVKEVSVTAFPANDLARVGARGGRRLEAASLDDPVDHRLDALFEEIRRDGRDSVARSKRRRKRLDEGREETIDDLLRRMRRWART